MEVLGSTSRRCNECIKVDAQATESAWEMKASRAMRASQKQSGNDENMVRLHCIFCQSQLNICLIFPYLFTPSYDMSHHLPSPPCKLISFLDYEWHNVLTNDA